MDDAAHSESVYGRFELNDLLPTQKALSSALDTRSSPVAIVFSEYSNRVLEPGSTWLLDNVDTWERYAKSLGLTYDVIADSTVERGGLAKYSLVILPCARALSDPEIAALKQFLDRGGSIFATSGTGSYRDDGEWRGWEFLSEVYGVQFAGEINPGEATKIHTLRGGLPITAGIPTGYSLNVATWDRPMACEVLEPRTTQASFWYNFRSDSGLVGEALEKTAGIVYGSYGRGRFVWMGFELNSVLGEQADYIFFDKLCKNAIEWLTFQPTVVVRDWPSPYSAAAVVAPFLSQEFSNTQNLLKVVAAHQTPVTFFVDPAAAKLYQPIVRSLTGYGELGAIVDFGVPQPEQGHGRLFPYDVQRANCVQAKAALEGVSDTRVVSALAMNGMSDENTYLSLMASGFTSLLLDSVIDRAVPNNIIRAENSIVAIGKTVIDDRNVIVDYGLTTPAYQLYTYKEGVDRVVFQGGMYVLRVHSHLQCRAEYVGVVGELLQYLREKNFWLATVSEAGRWWRTKSSLEVSVKTRSSRRIALVISNPTGETIRNAGIDVGVNKRFTNLEITSDIIGTEIPGYKPDYKRQMVAITIRELAGGESLSFFLDFDNVNS